MEKDERIRKNSHFRFIYSRGKSLSNDVLVMYIFRNGKKINRIGVSVSKKIGKSVTRNRIKRLIKESFRKNKDSFKKGYDLIFIARKKAAEANYIIIENTIKYLIKKGGLLIEEEKK